MLIFEYINGVIKVANKQSRQIHLKFWTNNRNERIKRGKEHGIMILE